jgi:segregation and condensation protein A
MAKKPELKLVEDTGSQLLESELIPELPPQQSEMPFAVVEGEPMTELPRDLYIPPDALQVFLEAFEGPLDLLLYLIRRQNLDILDIPIAEITRQYMQYIEVMADLQLELAGEYLLMAAMLAEIKSRMLLPRPPSVDGQDEEDPRAELVRRLQEYERFKKAAEDIDKLTRLERDTMPASAELLERKVVKIQPQVSLQEMLLAFKDVLKRADMFAHHHVSRERLSVRQRMSDILSTLREVAFMEFTALFRAEEGRMGVTVTFIGILELMKEGLIEIVQAEAYAPIHVRTAQSARHLTVVQGGISDADAENQAALAQPAHPDENDLPEDDEPEPEPESGPEVEAAAVVDNAEPQALAAVEEAAEAVLGEVEVGETLIEGVLGEVEVGQTLTEAVLGEAEVGETIAEVVLGEAEVGETIAEVVLGEAEVGETITEVVLGEAEVEETLTEAVPDEAEAEETLTETVFEEAEVEEALTEAATDVSTETIVEASADIVTEVSADVGMEESTDAPDADLSTDDDSVTREAGETDNPDAEPSK